MYTTIIHMPVNLGSPYCANVSKMVVDTSVKSFPCLKKDFSKIMTTNRLKKTKEALYSLFCI